MNTQPIIDYYEGATPDYETWSRNYNMHFGYWKLGLNPFRREPQLEEMNERVIARLGLNGVPGQRVIDLGCGVGATLRHGAKANPNVEWTGVSLVPWHINKARQLNGSLPIRLVCSDYTACPFPDANFDAVYALESSCHAEGPGKRKIVEEMFRLLRPGGRLALADGILASPASGLPWPFRAIHDLLCLNWAVPGFAELGPLLESLKAVGFVDLHIENLRWRIAPSVLHSPHLVLAFVAAKILRGKPVGAVTRRHLMACLLAPVMGMHPDFGYYLISARKPGNIS